MKHLQKGRKFSREKSQREAMFRTMLGSLILQEKIKTTEAKAKEIKGIADNVISKAKLVKDETKRLSALKYLYSRVPKKAVEKLKGEFINKFSDRNGGCVRILKLAARKSDSAKMAIVEFVND